MAHLFPPRRKTTKIYRIPATFPRLLSLTQEGGWVKTLRGDPQPRPVSDGVFGRAQSDKTTSTKDLPFFSPWGGASNTVVRNSPLVVSEDWGSLVARSTELT